MSLTFVTGNKNKLTAMQIIIPGLLQSDIDLEEIQDLNPETVTRHKVSEAQKHLESAFIVEDSFMIMDCMNGLPGPFIKYFLSSIGPEGLYEISQRFQNANATAGVLIGYSDAQKNIHLFKGTVQGTIVAPKGSHGFGYDSIFVPDGYDKTYGEMTIEEKATMSQRTIATLKLKEYLDAHS